MPETSTALSVLTLHFMHALSSVTSQLLRFNASYLQISSFRPRMGYNCKHQTANQKLLFLLLTVWSPLVWIPSTPGASRSNTSTLDSTNSCTIMQQATSYIRHLFSLLFPFAFLILSHHAVFCLLSMLHRVFLATSPVPEP